MIYFVHIHRTGGTTFKAILRNNFGTHALFINDKSRANEEFNDKEYELLSRFINLFNIKALESHNLRFPPPSSFNCNNLMPITFLRNPTERFLSNYFYLQQISGKMHYSQTDFENYVKFIKKNHNNDVRYFNGQVFQIANEFNLEKAKSIINKFFFVGLTEKYDESLILLRKKLKEHNININICYERKNIGIQKIKKKDYELEIKKSAIFEEVKLLNELDIKLYNYVKEKISMQLSSFGNKFYDELGEFTLKNKN